MKLEHVTITGADDSVDPSTLAIIMREFPFAEWGLLASHARRGSPRYPSAAWLRQLASVDTNGAKFSVHVCGQWARQLFSGDGSALTYALADGPDCQRVQINGVYVGKNPSALSSVQSLWKRQVILQSRGLDGEDWYVKSLHSAGLHTAVLYDCSGGHGITPCDWPLPWPATFCGYAGGLGPENLQSELYKIEDRVGDRTIWIDMESAVRTDEKLDLRKVRTVLAISSRFA